MYCTCNLNNQWAQRFPHQNTPTVAGCTELNTIKNCVNSNSNSCLPSILSQSNNTQNLQCQNLRQQQQHQQQSHSQNVTPWRYCTCKNRCYYCNNLSWWPTCPRLSSSQSSTNCLKNIPNYCQHYQQQQLQLQQQQQQQDQQQKLHQTPIRGNMLGVSAASPTSSASPPPAPPPHPPSVSRTNSGVCSRCRFANPSPRQEPIADAHLHSVSGQQASNCGNAYTGE